MSYEPLLSHREKRATVCNFGAATQGCGRKACHQYIRFASICTGHMYVTLYIDVLDIVEYLLQMQPQTYVNFLIGWNNLRGTG